MMTADDLSRKEEKTLPKKTKLLRLLLLILILVIIQKKA